MKPSRWMSLLLLPCLFGCEPMLRPSAAARQRAFEKHQQLFLADRDEAVRKVFFVLSCDADAPDPAFEGTTHSFSVDFGEQTTVNQGLAVAIADDGYLLTAGHVLGEKNFVIGECNGRIELKPVRIVLNHESTAHADVAVIHVQGPLDHCAVLGETPAAGAIAFAALCERDKRQSLGGTIRLAGAKVHDTTPGPDGSNVILINSDIPLWQGDSGGPLLSADGRLIGIITGWTFNWYGLYWNYQRLSFLPHKQWLESILTQDRARHNGG